MSGVIGVRIVGIVLLAGLAGCAGNPPPPAAVAARAVQVTDRQLVRSATVELTVEDLAAAATGVEDIIAGAEGRIESSNADGGNRVDLRLRIPEASLDAVLLAFHTVGKVTRERVSSHDVTDQLIDLDARLQNLIAVRDRLRGYLDRAEDVQDIVAVERELTRVQSEIDSLSGTLERMRGQVAMSQVDLRMDRKRTLGPLGILGAGVGWFFKKLIFIN